MISKSLQAELRAKYNPDGSKLRNLQLRELEILKFIDDICKANGIKYWLSAGTCLGAVRHGGFIPWDDDVDIEMMEADYFKFKKIILKNQNERYVFQCINTDPNYLLGFGKVRDLHSRIDETLGYDKKYRYKGCFVDVFPVAPSNSRILHKIGIYIDNNMVFSCRYSNKKNTKYWKILYRSLIPILRNLTKIGAKSIYRYSVGVPFPNVFIYDEISKTTNLNFEGLMLPVPYKYQSYLTRMYGDYMKIPNSEEIHIHTTKFELY